MRFVDEFRNPVLAERLVAAIRSLATRPWVIMEVCGGQTHSLLRYGIDEALEGAVELIHGPGCPVCVTDAAAIDLAIDLAAQPGCVVASFGDMLRVPGTRLSLWTAKAQGANVLPVYSPIEAVDYASRHPEQQVIFFAVGFETTVPSTALAVLQARARSLSNFSLLTSHVQVLPAMEQIAGGTEQRVQAFLAAGHVCTITGFESYEDFASRHGLPVVVAGFEPLDLLQGIHECVRQLESGVSAVCNLYSRSVTSTGNQQAQSLMREVFESCDQVWRGFGSISAGGFGLRAEFRDFDARLRFSGASTGGPEQLSGPSQADTRCRAGEVLSGRLKPCDCEEFGRGCQPESPLGAPMVSSEGACSAWFRYHGRAGNAGGDV